METNEIKNTSAKHFVIGQIVKPKGYAKDARIGKITAMIPPVGTAGEWSYYVDWYGIGSGSGWRDCDLQRAF